jgi:hypothetical protein
MKHILALVVAVALAWSFSQGNIPTPAPKPISPVAQVLASAPKEDRARVAGFYSALADVVERDDKTVNTVGVFRELHGKSLDLAFKGTDLPGKYPGLDTAINDLVVASVGRDDVPLPPAKRQALVQALKDIANASR